ncbi:MAG TPA: 30S ribosomal protein S9 [Rickettsiales bacterium]|nr:30S ribosomal protein S9 [Rickettsiales bacterium]
MSEEIKIKKPQLEAVVREAKIDAFGRSQATGKRKNSIARVWIKKGTGKITVNECEAKKYFGREILFNIAKYPFIVTKNENKFDVIATIVGGGKTGQAGALAHGISKALADFDPEVRKILRVDGFLTRDSRVVERKKYGLKKARKGQTYRKR